MPELPEVQTIIDDLNKKIKGDTVVSFWSEWPKAIKNKTLEKFKREIKNRQILGARRIGKNIFIDMSGGKTLYIHLKMTGHLLVKSQIAIDKLQTGGGKTDYFSDRVNQYIRHIWYLKSQKAKSKNAYDKTLEFSDLRKFGKIVLDTKEKISDLKEVKALGVDAMSPAFSLKNFQAVLKKYPRRPIGLLLMDQEIIAGIGNIYRSEILFEAGILPERPSGKIPENEIKKLYASTKKVLKKAIRLRGTSDSDYRDTAGAPGSFQKAVKVYRREKKKCPKCGTIVVRKTFGQRSVFFCPVCQK